MPAFSTGNLGRYWHTVRHLRSVQIYGRVWFRLHRPHISLAAAPALRVQSTPFRKPVQRKPSMTAASTFRFLNRSAPLFWPAGWGGADHEQLWLYNLHYFDDLNAENASARAEWHRALIDRWLTDNLPGCGVGWEPYPLSLRIVNWIKWSLAGNPLRPEWIESLAIQTRWLADRLEWHLLGNHLLANAKALIFAGAFFSGPEAQRWLNRGISILQDQLPEQILQDGGHFELSPMYHALVLEDLIDLVNLSSVYPDAIPQSLVRPWQKVIGRMRYWLACMCHPDGDIAFFNDAAFGIAAPPRELDNYLARCAIELPAPEPDAFVHLKDSGYVRVVWGDCTALLDIAAVGPSYLPGHAHADTLSFELSIGRQRVVVNGGTSQYGTGAGRHLERSTAAHNTVEIDGQNSSEVWSGFRVARRARVFGLAVERQADMASIACSHDGYARLPGRPVHRREWLFFGRSLKITDRILGKYQRAVVRFHLAPGAVVSSQTNGILTIAIGERKCEWRCSAPLQTEPSSWHPEFGKSLPSVVLTALVPPEGLQTEFRW